MEIDPRLGIAPLLATKESPVAPDAQPGWLSGSSGKVRFVIWDAPAAATARGTIVLAHGLSEQIEKYQRVVERLRKYGFAVVMIDWRGHGLSDNCPNQSREDFGVHDLDLAALLQAKVVAQMPQPIIGMGHSFGGCMICCSIHNQPEIYAAGILCAPMLDIKKFKQKPYLRYLSRLLFWLRPIRKRKRMQLGKMSRLTSDEQRFNLHQKLLETHPQLMPKYDLWFWAQRALDRIVGMRSPGWFERIAQPMLVLIAGEETIVDNDAAHAAVARMPNGRLVTIEGAWHEIMMETDTIQAKYWEAVEKFLDEVTPAKVGTTKQ